MNFDELDCEIKTKRLFLRPLQASDVVDIFNTAREYPEITRFMTWSPPEKIEETEGFFREKEEKAKSGEAIRWGVFHNDEFCGVISIEGICRDIGKWKVDMGELGYWLSPEVHNKGFMTEAVEAVLQFGFGNLKLNKINVVHVEGNGASEKVIKKSGFRHIGTAKKHLFLEEKWWDQETYELLADDFFASK